MKIEFLFLKYNVSFFNVGLHGHYLYIYVKLTCETGSEHGGRGADRRELMFKNCPSLM